DVAELDHADVLQGEHFGFLPKDRQSTLEPRMNTDKHGWAAQGDRIVSWARIFLLRANDPCSSVFIRVHLWFLRGLFPHLRAPRVSPGRGSPSGSAEASCRGSSSRPAYAGSAPCRRRW